MFERLNTPEEIFNFKLGATLKMEEKVLEILDDSIDHAENERVLTALRSHRAESEQHVTNVKEVFGLFGWDVDDSSCPAIEGLQKEAKATVKKTDHALVDLVILQGCVEVEHHEIGVYENLIIAARAIGHEDAAAVLERNLGDEKETLEEVKALLAQLAASTQRTNRVA
jgi:ferritin-like metal-binding protein YciE